MNLWESNVPLAQGNGREDVPHLELFPAATGRRSGLVIVCPGGGYRTRAAHEAEPIAAWLNSLGVSAAVLHYRVHPYAYPCALLDAQRAVRLARHHAEAWKIDPERIGLLGFSAGGHLASTAGTRHDAGNPGAPDPVERHSCRPDMLMLCYPVITFREPYLHRGSMETLIGVEPAPELRESLSNELQVKADTPPTFLWHTAEDDAVVPENSMLFGMALKRHRVPFELHIFERGRHGVGLSPDDPDTAMWQEQGRRWLQRRGWIG